jgi:1-acyl-sn-glycerol-3-phosphate acyltransferase
MATTQQIDQMRNRITDEIFFAFGIHSNHPLRKRLGKLFFKPTQRFSELVSLADEETRTGGLPAGARSLMNSLNVSTHVIGSGNIPVTGPVLVVSNHPGAYDSAALAMNIPRPDLRIIVSETRFYHTLPHIGQNLIYVTRGGDQRMLALRQAILHLHQGGAILQFGTGTIEPDPAYTSLAQIPLSQWSRSVEIMLRKAQETTLVLAGASGVLLKKYLGHPLTRLRRKPVDRRRVAEFLQVIAQLMHPENFNGETRISFSNQIKMADLLKSDDRNLMAGVITRATELLEEHQSIFYPSIL